MNKVFIFGLAASLAVSSAFAVEAKGASKTVVKKAVKSETAEKTEVRAEKTVKTGKKECVRFGIKVGASIANLAVSPSGTVTLSNKIGRTNGVFMEIPLGKSLAFQPEFLYVEKGATADTGSSTVHSKYEADYFDIQPLLKIRLGNPESAARPNFFLGPQLGLKIALRMVEWDSTGGAWSDAPSGQIHSTDFGVVGGMGLDLKKVTFDVRYNLGLINLLTSTGGAGSMKNRALLATVGYLFN